MSRWVPLLIACGLASPIAGLPAHPADTIDLSRAIGEVALDDWPHCNFLVVRTQRGFSLATWQSGLWTFGEGDRVYGPVDRAGLQMIAVAGPVMSGEMSVEVEEVGVDLARAQSVFYKRCKIE